MVKREQVRSRAVHVRLAPGCAGRDREPLRPDQGSHGPPQIAAIVLIAPPAFLLVAGAFASWVAIPNVGVAFRLTC